MTTLFLMIAAGIFKAVMDTLQFHFFKSVFASKAKEPSQAIMEDRFWNPELSWENKWKNGDKAQGEKFLGSSTVFVFTTDAWHLFQFFFLNTMILAIVLYEPLINWWADFLIYAAVMKSVFQLCYGRLLVKS
jgi:hypothetical protein